MKTYIKPQSQTIKLHTERIIAESVKFDKDTTTRSNWTRRRMWDEEEEQ